jgi:hypothetical protein
LSTSKMLRFVVVLLFVTSALGLGLDLTKGQCLSLPSLTTPEGKTARLTNPCVGVVNYPFYVKQGSDLATLEATARTALGGINLMQLGSGCLPNVIALTCANIYLKCVPSVDVTDTTTYDRSTYDTVQQTFGLPFQRPCKTVCSTVSSTCATSLLSLISTAPNCTAHQDYSMGNVAGATPNQYDATTATCFSPTTPPATVGSPTEVYTISSDPAVAPCSGYVESMFVPPASKLDATFTPIQLPGTVQKLMNTAVSAGFANLPSFLPPDCKESIQQLVCRSTFLKPMTETLKQGLTNSGIILSAHALAKAAPLLANKLTFPRYPVKSVCNDLNLKCAAFLPQMKLINPTLDGNCSKMVNGIYIFPTQNQTISSLAVSSPLITGTVKFYTVPNSDPYFNVSQVNTKMDLTKGQCATLPTLATPEGKMARLINPCIGVVDYPFYMKPSDSLKSLETAARTLLGQANLMQLGSTCLPKYLALTCANIYLKCVPSVDVKNPATYDLTTYGSVGQTFGLPFQRPCKSFCGSVATSCATSLLAVTGGAVNCTANQDYSYGRIYDVQPDAYGLNPATCFSPTAPPAGTGSPSEHYAVSSNPAVAPCSGYVDNMFVPPANKLNTSFTVIQLPGTVQNLMNTAVSKGFSGLPAFLPQDCKESLQQFICRSTFLKPMTETLKQGLTNSGIALSPPALAKAAPLLANKLTFPRYPVKSVCNDLNLKCTAFLPQMKLVNPTLDANCSKEVGGISIFPNHNQTIASLAVSSPLITGTVKFYTVPNDDPYFNVTQINTKMDLKQGQCASLPALATAEGKMARLVNPCVGVVDYPFYVKPGDTLKSLETAARTLLGSLSLMQLGSTCIPNYVALTCANIYLKCVPGVDVKNPTTYDMTIYNSVGQTFGLPFQRPCKSVCGAAATGCATSLLAVFGSPMNCSANQDYSYGNVYSAQPDAYGTNPATCFSPVTPPAGTGAPSEPYIVSADPKVAPCSGFVGQMFVPPASRIDATYTPIQLPGTVQTMLNTAVAAGFSNLPAYLPKACHDSLQEYICRSTFLKPMTETLKQALIYSGKVPPAKLTPFLPSKLTFPSYPMKDVCVNFNQQCKAILPNLIAKNPALDPNCSKVVAGVAVFPDKNQTISILVTPNPLIGTLSFYTTPNSAPYFSAAERHQYQPQCPTGFVVPDDPSNEDVVRIGESACAMGCL